MSQHLRRYPNDRTPKLLAFRDNAPAFLALWNKDKEQASTLLGHLAVLRDDVAELKAFKDRGIAVVGQLIVLPDGIRAALRGFTAQRPSS